jgi:hypothetical protein
MSKAFVVPNHEDHDAIVPNPESETVRRINSVIPLVIKEVNRFLPGLSPGRRAQLDATDLLQEVWRVLLERDHYYDPARGAYTTFALMIVKQKLGEIGKRSRVDRCRKPLDCDMSDPNAATAEETALEAEASAVRRQSISRALERIESDTDFSILCWSYGLAGRAPRSVAEQATMLLMTIAQVIHRRNQAEQEIRRILAPIMEAG